MPTKGNLELTLSPDKSGFCGTSPEKGQIVSEFGLVFLKFGPYLVLISHFFVRILSKCTGKHPYKLSKTNWHEHWRYIQAIDLQRR